MGNLIGNLTGFEGRISRQAWWIGVIVLIVVAIVLNFIVGAIMGGGGIMTLAQALDPAVLQRAAWQNLIISAIITYPYLALSFKRRHDRNNNGYDAAALIILSLLWSLVTALGIVTPVGTVGMVVGLIFLVLGIYVLVQLGFLKGTAGPNQYGPDPLGG